MLSSPGLQFVIDCRQATVQASGVNRKDVFTVVSQMRRDHLLFACPFTFTLWLKVVGNLFGIDPNPDWDTTLERLQNGTYDRLMSVLLLLVFQVSVYFIWIERNDRKHSNRAKSVEQLAKLIDKTVRNMLSSTHYFLKPKLKGIMCRWFEAHFHRE